MRLRHNKRSTRNYRTNRRRYPPQAGVMSRRGFLTLGLLGGLSLATAGTAGWLLNNNEPVRQEHPQEQPIQDAHLHTVLIDSSDPITSSQRQQIDNLLKVRFMEAVKKHDHIAVSLLTHERFNPVEWVFEASDPGKGSETNILFNTPHRVDQQRNEQFLSGYHEAISAAQIPIDRPKTPLIAGLESLSKHHSFRGGYGDQNTYRHRRLLIVTDGLENSEVSAYRGTLYGQRGKNYVSQHLADFKGVEVTVALINRPKYRHLQNARHWEWLKGYLQRCGASVRRVDIV